MGALPLVLLALAGPPQEGPAASLQHLDEGYVGSQACARCHEANHASWHASFHRTMTQAPGAAAVLAPFEGRTPAHQGVSWLLERADGAYLATPTSDDGEPLGPAARVALTTGSHHYQIYWVVTPRTTSLVQLPLVWHVGEQAWAPRRAMFLIPPGPAHDEDDRWQEVCIKCHATNGTPDHPDFDATRVAELGIACEACHGPGQAHVEWRTGPGAGEDGPHESDPVSPADLDAERASQVCGQCHGIHLFADDQAYQAWWRKGFAYRPGDDLSATRTLLRGRARDNGEGLRAFLAEHPGALESRFWSDGEVRISGREYNGLVASPCFVNGHGERRLSCLSCHELHASPERVAAGWADDQLRAGKDGPGACLGCHGELAAPEAWEAHAHHPLDEGSSGGASCLDCHMPFTTYGLTKAIRSHTISSPSVAVSLATGRPNACNQCHLDRTLAWAAERLHEWYGQPLPELDEEQRSVAASVLWTLTGDAGQRALMAWSLDREVARQVSGTGWMPPLISTLLLDDYDAVRWIAQRVARRLPGRADFRLDACADPEDQRNVVRETILSDWLEAGLSATPEQASAVLVRPDGTLDEERFRALWNRRDQRPVSLAE
jgi:hypothetical protein